MTTAASGPCGAHAAAAAAAAAAASVDAVEAIAEMNTKQTYVQKQLISILREDASASCFLRKIEKSLYMPTYHTSALHTSSDTNDYFFSTLFFCLLETRKQVALCAHLFYIFSPFHAKHRLRARIDCVALAVPVRATLEITLHPHFRPSLV